MTRYLDELCERVVWLGAVQTPNLVGVDDLDTFASRVRAAQAKLRRYADELGALADEATNAVGALEEP